MVLGVAREEKAVRLLRRPCPFIRPSVHLRPSICDNLSLVLILLISCIVSVITKLDTEEHNNRQNINMCIRNWDTNTERQKAIERF